MVLSCSCACPMECSEQALDSIKSSRKMAFTGLQKPVKALHSGSCFLLMSLQHMALLRSFMTVGGFTFLSRITGFIRDMIMANVLGTGFVADSFFVAQRFPNLFRGLFAEGAFSAAFVPQFSAILEREGKENAKNFASLSFTVLSIIVGIFTFLSILCMPFLINFFAPGFRDVPGKSDLTSSLSIIMFPYLFFVSLCSLLSGILNSSGKFSVPASMPVLLNIIMIFSLFFLASFVPTTGHALAWGVLIAGVIQFVWLMIAVHRAGLMPWYRNPSMTPEIRALIARIIPIAFGAGAYQINLWVSTVLASMMSDGAVSYLYYADRVNQLPVGVVGIAVGTALLPMMARQLSAGNLQGALDSQNRSVEFVLALTLPAMAALIILANPIITVLFRHGAFSAADAAATSHALVAFAIGLPAYVLVPVFIPGFYAREDTKTPVRIAVGATLINLILNLVLVQFLEHVGIALATAMASIFNVTLLGMILIRRKHYVWDARLRFRLPRIILSTFIMSLVLIGLRKGVDFLFIFEGVIPPWIILGFMIGVGGMVYGAVSFLTGALQRSDLSLLWRKQRPIS